jgi:hypothetical protein
MTKKSSLNHLVILTLLYRSIRPFQDDDKDYDLLYIRHSEQRPFASLKAKNLVFSKEDPVNTENEILRHSDGAIKPRQTSSG